MLLLFYAQGGHDPSAAFTVDDESAMGAFMDEIRFILQQREREEVFSMVFAQDNDAIDGDEHAEEDSP